MLKIKIFKINASNQEEADKISAEITAFRENCQIADNGIQVVNDCMYIEYLPKDSALPQKYQMQVIKSNIEDLRNKLVKAYVQYDIAERLAESAGGTDKQRADRILTKQKVEFITADIKAKIKAYEETLEAFSTEDGAEIDVEKLVNTHGTVGDGINAGQFAVAAIDSFQEGIDEDLTGEDKSDADPRVKKS